MPGVQAKVNAAWLSVLSLGFSCKIESSQQERAEQEVSHAGCSERTSGPGECWTLAPTFCPSEHPCLTQAFPHPSLSVIFLPLTTKLGHTKLPNSPLCLSFKNSDFMWSDKMLRQNFEGRVCVFFAHFFEGWAMQEMKEIQITKPGGSVRLFYFTLPSNSPVVS